MNKNLLYSLIITPFLIFAFYSTSYSKKTFAPPNHTGALGEASCGFSGTATNTCHGAPGNCGNIPSTLSTLNKDVTITANGTLVDASFKYVPETVYTMEFTVANPDVSGGFSFTAKDIQDNYVGILAPDASSDAALSTNSKYIGHTNSFGKTDWTFKWTAPIANTGIVTFFASTLKGNGEIGQAPVNWCGDEIIPVKFEINEDTTNNPSDVSSIVFLNEVSVLNNPILNNTIMIETIVKEPKKYFVSVYDLSGKKIMYTEQFFHTGMKIIEIPITKTGVLIVNIITDKNEIANFKVLN